MRRPRNNAISNQGFSLVEILIGMTISLAVGAAAVGYLITSSRNLSSQTNQDLVQENVRFAYEILATNIRLAGMVNTSEVTTGALDAVPVGINICSADYNQESTDATSSLCNVDNANNMVGPAGNQVAFVSDRLAIESVTKDVFQTCSGVVVTPVQTQRIVTVFWAADIDADGVSSLYCQSFSSPEDAANYAPLSGAIPLIDGVEMFQYQLGIDMDNDLDVDIYTSLSNLPIANSSEVMAIRVGLLLNSGLGAATQANTEVANSRTYTVLDATHVTPNTDRQQRQTTSMTIFLPNSGL